MIQDFGVLISDFEPLHLGHLRHIMAAVGQVKTLHVVITPSARPHSDFVITLQDKARWLQMACADLPFVVLHLSQAPIPAYDAKALPTPLGDYKTQISALYKTLECPTETPLYVTKDSIFAQLDDVQDKEIETAALPFMTLETTGFDSAAIAADPVAYWSALHPEARGDYTKTVAIVGGESSGKTTLLHKLVNYYGASYALEMGRLYVGTDLGGSELGLQYSDYAPIALDHAEAMRAAKKEALAPVTIIDTDFVTTQAFCEEYEGRTHPFVAACAETFRCDYTIMLDNNTPWVDDGMRSLGDPEARGRFEARLLEIFARHNIIPHVIDAPDYDARYEAAVAFINAHIYQQNDD
ncbi:MULTISPECIES: multifunctional transcriptional regulator/nicotinamide-nucleotide adenylyltransferase/ribosylnicotinamide kinase NadR [unclassified Psychrobacter]|uniref:multifunctional transcriptional regulator/nicotinamide-nucleotide adenylyltransferase/ribosylnicotinamide kinase NadR n=1 Tax=unclassified Psychrobacter TaxID=196806 RepID=UPI001A7EB96F|nr:MULTISPECIES: multifunctional transcriptional regulator/nicotinamide-nucleotide adenylyltransferase/ribosylnicotinamide kinase NadR [unclassified Psychrobacter]